MRKNSSGKVLTIFFVIIVILMTTLAAAAMFFLNKETESRKATEALLAKSRAHETELDGDLKKTKKDNFLLQEKNKEADERINDLSSELDLEKGLREELKTENIGLKEKQEKLSRDFEEAQSKLAESAKKVDELVFQLKTANDQRDEIERRNKDLQDKVANLDQGVTAESQLSDEALQKDQSQIQLAPIVVSPTKVPAGRILTVDNETEFVIFNLGERDGVKAGDLMSVYRGPDYLGDVKVTRVQAEMSSADFVPPFSSRVVRKNDQVVVKQ